MTHRKCCIRLHLVLCSPSAPGKRNPVSQSGSLAQFPSSCFQNYLASQQPTPHLSRISLGWAPSIFPEVTFPSSHDLPRAAFACPHIRSRSEVTVPSRHISLLPRLFPGGLLSWKAKVSWWLAVRLFPSKPSAGLSLVRTFSSSLFRSVK